jgi:O-antigen ligase
MLGQKIRIFRRFLECNFLPVLLLLFIISFFAAPNNKILNKFYFFMVLPTAVLSLRLADYRWLYKLILLRYLLLLLAYLCLSLCWSSIIPGGKPHPQEYIFQSLYILYFVIIIIITAQYRDNWLAWLGPGLALIVTMHIIVVSWIWYSAHPFTVRMEGLGRLNNPLELASIYAAVAAFCSLSYLKGRDKMSHVYLVPFFVSLGGIVLTRSRGPLLAIVLVTLGASLLIRNQRSKYLIALIVFIGLACLAIEPNLLYSLSERGASFRPEIWKAGWPRIMESWIFGHGIATSSKVIIDGQTQFNHYHNIILSTWFYSGIIGILLLVILISKTIIYGLRNSSAWPWVSAFIAGSLCLLTNGDKLIIHPYQLWLYFWLPLAMIIATASEKKAEDQAMTNRLKPKTGEIAAPSPGGKTGA